VLIAARRPEDRAEAVAALAAASSGVSVQEVGTFAEALHGCRAEPPDCVLLHLDLPDAGIFRAVGTFARRDGAPDVPVIVLASRLGAGHCRELVRAGAEDAIGSDALPGGLARAVEHAVERRRGVYRRDDALHAELERGRIAIANTDDGVWDWDVLADRVYWSERWYRMLGYEPGVFVPSFETFIALVHPDDRPRVTADNDRHNAGSTPAFEAEFRMRCADGGYRWILSRAKSVFDERGRMTRVVGFHIDIDARRRAEHSVARRSAGLELLNAGAAELLATRDPDVLIENLFRRVAEFVGADVYFHFRVDGVAPGAAAMRLAMSAGIDDGVRRGFERLEFGRAVCGVTACERRPQYRPELQASTDEAAAALRALGLGVYACYPLIVGEELLGTLGFGSRARTGFGDDERTLLEATGRHVAAVLNRTRTEQAERRANEQRLASEERMRLALQSASLGAWDWDLVADRVVWSPECAAIFGLPLERFAGKFEAFGEFVLPEDAGVLGDASAFAQSAAPGDPARVTEFRIRRPDGEVRWLVNHGRVLHGEGGVARRVVGVVGDITDRKRAEQERERLLEAERAARIDADRAGRLKDEFLATISHELRTPLNSILGWSRLLLRDGVQPAMYDEGVRVIERNAKVQAQLISDLLDVNRIASGRLCLELGRVAVNDVAVAALETVQAAARERGVALTSTLAPDLPPVNADFARLQQVLWNLLTNAIKFTPAGRAVTLETRLAGDRVEVEIRDAGQGIAAEFLPHVFDRFRQADGSIARRHGGLGLGLAIVKQLIEMHGGEVSAESEGSGQGATFHIRLPALPFAHGGAGADYAAPVNRDSLRGVQVLLVDDQTDALEFMRRLLAEHGAEVRTATRAEDALAMLKEAGEGDLPRLLVSDIGMPGMDGYELLRAVRVDLGLGPERLPAVAVTAFAREDDRRDAEAVGYQAHLTKPFQPDRLIAALNSLARPRTGEPPSVLA
jgi:PAS domain S-box-containing protein